MVLQTQHRNGQGETMKLAGELGHVPACRGVRSGVLALRHDARQGARHVARHPTWEQRAPKVVDSLQASNAVATPPVTLAKQSESVWPGIVLLSLSGASGFWLARGMWCHPFAEIVWNGLGVLYFLGAILLMICSWAPQGLIEISHDRTRLINVPQGFRSTAQAVDVSRLRSLEFTEIVDVEGASRYSISLVIDGGSRLELHSGNGSHAKKQVARISDWLQSQLAPASLPSVWRVVG